MIKNVLLTYDVSIRQTEVKNGMKGKGYYDNIKRSTENETYTLPNTTIWKKGEELKTETALKDLQDVIETLNRDVIASNKIKLEKAMAVEFTNWNAIEN